MTAPRSHMYMVNIYYVIIILLLLCTMYDGFRWRTVFRVKTSSTDIEMYIIIQEQLGYADETLHAAAAAQYILRE